MQNLFHDFFLSIFLLHLDSQLSKESSNHQKIGDINEALQICKQPMQTASVQLNAFRSNQKKSEKISAEDCVEMAKVKLKYFSQNQIAPKRIELEGCGLRQSLANLKGFNYLTNFLMIV